MIKARRVWWAGHVARMGGRGIHVRYWRESQKTKDNKEDQYGGGWIILKWILER
jgi:hypothetical protein